MKKRYLAAILASTMLTTQGVVFAEEAVTENEINGDIAISMTLDDAIAYALENSQEISSAESSVESALYSISDAKMTLKSYDKMDRACVSLEENMVVNGQIVDINELSYEIAKRTLETTKESLKISIKSDFYTYLSNKEKTKIAQTNLELAQGELEYAAVKLNSGTISQIDYMNFELQLTDAKNKYEQAKRTEEISLIQLKNTINLPEQTKLTPIGSYETQEYVIADAETAIMSSRNHYTYLTMVDGLECSAIRWRAAQGWYASNEYGYKIEKATYDIAALGFEQNVKSLDMGIRNTYNGILTLEENINYFNGYVELLAKSVEAAKLQYDMGMITANSYIDIQNDYFNAQNQLLDLELTYETTVLTYRSMYTID